MKYLHEIMPLKTRERLFHSVFISGRVLIRNNRNGTTFLTCHEMVAIINMEILNKTVCNFMWKTIYFI